MSRSRVLGLCLVLVALSVIPAGAADAPGAGVLVGANVSSASLNGADATNISAGTKAGLDVGVFVLWPLTGRLAIQPELAFSQQHFTVKDSVSGFSATEQWNWIELPVLARVAVWRSGKAEVFLLAGPGFNVCASAKEAVGGSSSDVKDDVQSTYVSLMGGAGLAVGHAAIEARYDRGLRDLNKNNGLGDLLTVKGHTVTVNVTWRFK